MESPTPQPPSIAVKEKNINILDEESGRGGRERSGQEEIGEGKNIIPAVNGREASRERAMDLKLAPTLAPSGFPSMHPTSLHTDHRMMLG